VAVISVCNTYDTTLKEVFYNNKRDGKDMYGQHKIYRPELLRFEFVSGHCKVDLSEVKIKYNIISHERGALYDALRKIKDDMTDTYFEDEEFEILKPALELIFQIGYGHRHDDALINCLIQQIFYIFNIGKKGPTPC
jgi:hypothetical protein